MASFEDSQVTRNKRVAVGFIVALGVIAIALLAWAFWPSSTKPRPTQKPVAEKPKPVEPVSPPPPSIVKVTFRGQAGTKVTVAGTTVGLGAAVELPPGPVSVRYVCPAKKKQKPRTLEISPDIPASRDGVTIDVPCL